MQVILELAGERAARVWKERRYSAIERGEVIVDESEERKIPGGRAVGGGILVLLVDDCLGLYCGIEEEEEEKEEEEEEERGRE